MELVCEHIHNNLKCFEHIQTLLIEKVKNIEFEDTLGGSQIISRLRTIPKNHLRRISTIGKLSIVPQKSC